VEGGRTYPETSANRTQVLFNNGIGKARTRIMKLKGSARPFPKGGKADA